jgi:hypothetical protein
MSSFRELSAFELLERIGLRGEDAHSWIAIVVGSNQASEAVQEFATEIQSQSEDNTNVRIVSIKGFSPREIRDKVQSPGNDAVILLGFEEKDEDFWAGLDINRSALERSGSLFFWLSYSALSDLCRYAPNVRSYIGPSIFAFTGTKGALTDEARQQRLKELAEKFKMSDSEIIRRAEEKKIEPEPEFVEWLLLLRRGDLV